MLSVQTIFVWLGLADFSLVGLHGVFLLVESGFKLAESQMFSLVISLGQMFILANFPFD